MNTDEIRAAARSTTLKAPCDRDAFVQNSYQNATEQEKKLIKELALKFDDFANDAYENQEHCIYNGGFYETHKHR